MMTWEQSPGSTKPFREIKEALKSDELILATDPDKAKLRHVGNA